MEEESAKVTCATTTTAAAAATTPMEDESSSAPQGDDASTYHLLVEFAYRHVDFQMAELESLLLMNGIVLGSPQCRIVPLINQNVFCETQAAFSKEGTAKQLTGDMRRPFVLLAFDAPWLLQKTTEMKGEEDDKNDRGQAIASRILSRCALVRSVSELWAMAPTIQACAAQVKTWTEQTTLGRETLQRLSSQSWKVTVHTLGCKYTVQEQNEMRQQFQFLHSLGPVKLRDCDNEYILIREVELDAQGGAIFPRFDQNKTLITANDERSPLTWYFGRVLGGQRQLKGRGQIETYSLKKRAYLGPTSMDTELSFIMTNLAHVKQGSVVMDPFVGTGSILLSCALRGAYCMGTDIDIRVLRGKGADQNVFSNFAQYGLPRPELIRSDNALYHRHYRTEHALYDAIVTDPPYGIRAGARQSGSRHDQVRDIPDKDRYDHIAQTKPYPVSDVMADLVEMAARTLVMGGRLVYIIPSMKDFDPDADLPRHPCLKIIHICYQPLSLDLGRRLVAMEKIENYNVSERDSYLQYVWKNGHDSAEKCANLRDKILEAAKRKPGYEEKAAARKQKRREHKEARKRSKQEEQNESASKTDNS